MVNFQVKVKVKLAMNQKKNENFKMNNLSAF